MAKNLLSPIPFREVFVILALFLKPRLAWRAQSADVKGLLKHTELLFIHHRGTPLLREAVMILVPVSSGYHRSQDSFGMAMAPNLAVT